MPKPQSFANHRAFPPPVYLLIGVVIAAELVRRAWIAFQTHDLHDVWNVVFVFGLVVLWAQARRRAQIVQDRVIRLEMRMRLERILGPQRRSDIESIGLPQIIALRFASDTELRPLFEDVLAGRLEKPDDIKRRVKDWQADWLRV